MTRQPPLDLEALEARLVPAGYGVPWPAPEQLTLSFVPDGTRAGSQQSELSSWGNLSGDWQSAILRAAQTWAEVANLNIGVVEDEGLLLGTAGAIQGDRRFGDIRVAAYPMSDEVLAIGTPFDPLAATHSGDLKFNSRLLFSADGIDLYTVALHELGHALGLDHSDDPDSVMYENYDEARTGLSASDVTAIRALYGARPVDEYDARQRNDTPAEATSLPAALPLSVAAYLEPGDRDHYAIRLTGTPGEVQVRLHTAGLSLLTGTLSVYNDQGVLLTTVAARGPGEDVQLTLPEGRRFVLAVEAQDAAFGVGAYQLDIERLGETDTRTSRGPTRPGGQPPVIPLAARVYGRDDRFVAFAEGAGTDTYRFQVPHGAGESGALTILAWSTEATAPRLTLTDAQGDVLDATVLVNEGGTYVVQLPETMRGGVFLIRVEATGAYSLGLLNDAVEVELRPLFEDVPLTVGQEVTGTLTSAASQLTHFVLSGDGPATLEVTDSQGEVVGLLETLWGAPVTATLYLLAGEYQLRLLGESSASVWSARLSDPIGPRPAPVQQTPQPLPALTGTIGYLWELTMPGTPTPSTPAASTSTTPTTAIPGAGSPQSSTPTQSPTGTTASTPPPAPEVVEVDNQTQSSAQKRQALAPSERVGALSSGLERVVPFLVGVSGGETVLRSGTVLRDPASSGTMSGVPVSLPPVRLAGVAGTTSLDDAPTPSPKVPPATVGLVLPDTSTPPLSDESPTPVALSSDKEATTEAESTAPAGATRITQTLQRQRLSLVALLTVCTVGMLQRHSRDRQRPQEALAAFGRAGRGAS